MFKRGTALAAVFVAGFAAAPLAAHASTDVAKGDYSYAAIQDLANKGLIEGYPAGANLFGDRVVNRYEMAALVSRVVARLTDDPAATPAAAATPLTQDEINKLVQDYGVELAVMGTDISNLKLGVQALTDTALDQQKQIDKLTKVNKTKVDSGIATIKFSGLFQEWYMAGDKDVTNFGGGPGTGIGLTSSAGAATTDSTVANTFRIRRAELRFTGNINPQTYFNIMFDPSKNQNVTFKSTGAAATETVATNGTSPLQDFVVGYHTTPKLDLEIGQQKVPLSIEGYRSSSNLLTIERSLMNEVGYGAGRVGDIRDLGAWARYTEPSKFTAVAALADDGGNRQDLVDDNNRKELLLNGQYFPITGLQVGGYGEVSGGVGVANTQRRRAGVDFDYVKAQHELTGEYEEGYDNGDVVATRLKTQGSYLTYAYKLSPKWQAVSRYDYFNPNRDLHNQEKDLTLGVNYFLNGNNTKIQFNYIKRDISGPLNAAGQPLANAALGQGRYLYFTNFQESF